MSNALPIAAKTYSAQCVQVIPNNNLDKIILHLVDSISDIIVIIYGIYKCIITKLYKGIYFLATFKKFW